MDARLDMAATCLQGQQGAEHAFSTLRRMHNSRKRKAEMMDDDAEDDHDHHAEGPAHLGPASSFQLSAAGS